MNSSLVTNSHTINHLESIDWEEVPMWKALKIWANNERHIKCVDGNHYHFYHGQTEMKSISHSQVKNGKWFIEKM